MYHTETAAVDVTGACARLAPLPSARRDLPDATLIAQIATGDRFAMHALFARHKTRSIASSCASSAMRLAPTTSPARSFSRSGGVHTSFGGVRLRRPGCLRLRASRRSTSCGAGATPRPTWSTDASDPAADPEASLADKHRGAMLRQCLGALSPEHRTIIDLVYYHEKSVQEVAAIVGIPCATVKTRTFYARKKLSALLAAQGLTRGAA